MKEVKVEDIEKLLICFDKEKHNIQNFMKMVADFIINHPDLEGSEYPIVHSYKMRLKDRGHLREKIIRKSRTREITEENIFSEITDLAGVRILHLFQESFTFIDKVIRDRVAGGDWHFFERPKAYTWDPEAESFFKKFDLEVYKKETSYTSVHYVIQPRQNSPICCEIQVRTLFEEIWGEVDHLINYPAPTSSLACSEQLKVRSKITGAGSRLLDSLQRVHHMHRGDKAQA